VVLYTYYIPLMYHVPCDIRIGHLKEALMDSRRLPQRYSHVVRLHFLISPIEFKGKLSPQRQLSVRESKHGNSSWFLGRMGSYIYTHIHALRLGVISFKTITFQSLGVPLVGTLSCVYIFVGCTMPLWLDIDSFASTRFSKSRVYVKWSHLWLQPC
jgi:hypothetical protein